jgi:diacylglycerol kinase family enzyme
MLEHGMDIVETVEKAVKDGADLLGAAGGDGTQALVTEVAARHDLPMVVVPAGTRNHFARDLGLDRDDPRAAIAALGAGGVEIRVDLGRVHVDPKVVQFGNNQYEYRNVRTSGTRPRLDTGQLGTELVDYDGRSELERVITGVASGHVARPLRVRVPADRPGLPAPLPTSSVATLRALWSVARGRPA